MACWELFCKPGHPHSCTIPESVGDILALSSGPVKARRPFPHYCYLSSCSVSFSFFLNLTHFTCGLIMWRKRLYYSDNFLWVNHSLSFNHCTQLSHFVDISQGLFSWWLCQPFVPDFFLQEFFSRESLNTIHQAFCSTFSLWTLLLPLVPRVFSWSLAMKTGKSSLHKSSQSLAPSAP